MSVRGQVVPEVQSGGCVRRKYYAKPYMLDISRGRKILLMDQARRWVAIWIAVKWLGSFWDVTGLTKVNANQVSREWYCASGKYGNAQSRRIVAKVWRRWSRGVA